MLVALLGVQTLLGTLLERLKQGPPSPTLQPPTPPPPRKATAGAAVATAAGSITREGRTNRSPGGELGGRPFEQSASAMEMAFVEQQESSSDITTQLSDSDTDDTKIITIRPGDKTSCYETNHRNVRIVGSSGDHDHGSSRVKLKNIVDYKWEPKNYPGHLIAVHMDGAHIAYVINVHNKVTGLEGMIRVVNAQNGKRALIKGMAGEVLDLQFAHIEAVLVLASIDVHSLYVHRIKAVDGSLLCHLVVKVEDPLAATYVPQYDKVSWCPYIDAPDDEEDDSQLLVWARGGVFQCFKLGRIVEEHGVGQHIRPQDITSGYLKVTDESVTITWVALSPDGSTLGVGSTDGMVRFYQVYMHEKEPRCLHQWKPHDGQAVSAFFFLDNLTRPISDTYWKFALTGARDNSEWKLWDCGTWQCLQTLTFASADGGVGRAPPRFNAEIDRTSSYLVLSNMAARTCYVLQIVNESNRGAPHSGDPTADGNSTDVISLCGSANHIQVKTPMVYVKSVSEFALKLGILSFSIVDATVRRYKMSNDNYPTDELEDYDEEPNSVVCVVLRMFVVQSKSMQECQILYQPAAPAIAAPLPDGATATGGTLVSDNLASSKKVFNCIKDDGETSAAKTPNEGGDVVVAESSIASKKRLSQGADELEPPKVNALEAFLGITPKVSTAAAVAAAPQLNESSVGDADSKSDARLETPPPGASTAGKAFLMTPDAFTASDKENSDTVSTEVLNTILMLASVAGPPGGQTPALADNLSRRQLVNNKVLEETEQKRLQSAKKFISALDNCNSVGSSPSREVQEIMSLHDIDIIYSDEADDAAEEEVIAHGDEPLKSTDWQLPPPPKHSAALQNAANLIKQVVEESAAAQGHNGCHMAAPPLLTANAKGGSAKSISGATSSSEMEELNKKMSQLIELAQHQTKQISALQSDISDMQKATPLNSTKAFNEFAYKLEMSVSKLIEQYMKRIEMEHMKRMAMFMSGRDAQLREMRDSFFQVSNQFMVGQMGDIVAKVFSIELQRHLLPLLMSKMDHLQANLQADVAQKFTTFDLALKENVSKSVVEVFGKTVLGGVQDSLQQAFMESMTNTLIPAYEKSSQNMFQQLHGAFSLGMKEFMDQFATYVQNLGHSNEQNVDISADLNHFCESFESVLAKHRHNVAEILQDTRKDVRQIEATLTRNIPELIRAELNSLIQQRNVESALQLRKYAESGAPGGGGDAWPSSGQTRSQQSLNSHKYGSKITIKALLQQGHIQTAIHHALLANDLTLVDFAINSVDPYSVFGADGCILEQKVLLSLIQQISADMSEHNEVKQNYLSEALLAIDPKDPVTREHAPKVLQSLYRHCQVFLVNFPKSSQCSNVRMLMKAVETFKEQF